GITSCHVTITSQTGVKGSVEIQMESEELGQVNASFRLNHKEVKGFVTASKEESLGICQRLLDNFKMDLEEHGFTMDSESLIRGSRTSLHVGEYSQDTRNQDLYQVAKSFIQSIAGKDETAYEN
nr:hypothetical protein [Eubacterium sp.]